MSVPETDVPDCDISWETIPQQGCTSTTMPDRPGPSFVPPPRTIVPWPTGTTTTTVAPSSPATTVAPTTTVQLPASSAQEAPTTVVATVAVPTATLPATGSQESAVGAIGAGSLVLAGIVALAVARRRPRSV